MDLEFKSDSPAQTIEVGRRLGERLRGGEIMGLIGALGSGKTHLIKGIAAGAGADDPRSVNSPTFVIINEYEGRLRIYHIDAYRLNSEAEFEMLGFDDYCGPDTVVVIEWADKIMACLEGTDLITVRTSHLSQSERSISISNAPAYLVKSL
jgi:tRNA threonylcarbamoyladenosine biosynthesis protein TsaE